jgi:P2-related tail formation protein
MFRRAPVTYRKPLPMDKAPDDGTPFLAKHRNVFGWCAAWDNGGNGFTVAHSNIDWKATDFEGWYPLPESGRS